MRTTIRKIGNSRGVLIPKPMLAQTGLVDEVEITVEGEVIVLRKAPRKAREGWANSAKALARSRDDELVWPEFGSQDDRDLQW